MGEGCQSGCRCLRVRRGRPLSLAPQVAFSGPVAGILPTSSEDM